MKKIYIISLLLSITILAYSKDYKAAEIYSTQSYLFGRFEVSMKCSNVSGLLSTFFLYKNGSEQAGSVWNEIDVEVFGKNNGVSWQSNIISGTSAARLKKEAVHTSTESFADDFHKFVIEWIPDTVRWFVDDVLIRELVASTYAPVGTLNNAMSLRFNIWSSTSTSWVGTFASSKIPTSQFIEYVSYYSYDTLSNTYALSWTDDFTTFNNSRWLKANWTFDENRADFIPNNAVIENNQLVLKFTGPAVTKVETKNTTYLEAYPNPCEKYFYINSPDDESALKIFDSLGRSVLSQKLNSGKNTIDVSSLDKGIYFMKTNASTRKLQIN